MPASTALHPAAERSSEAGSVVAHQFSHPLFPNLNEGEIRRIQKARLARQRFLQRDLFADPAWDMLLELYASELGQQRVHIRLLCDASGVPDTTALRWIRKLEEEGLVMRQDVPNDRRQVWICLTPTASSAMQRYFATVSSGPIGI